MLKFNEKARVRKYIVGGMEKDGAYQTALDDEKFESTYLTENPVIRKITCKKCGMTIYC